MWNELTSESALRRRGWFDPYGVKEIRRLSQTGNLDLYMLQWAILTIEPWARQFIDKNPADFGDQQFSVKIQRDSSVARAPSTTLRTGSSE